MKYLKYFEGFSHRDFDELVPEEFFHIYDIVTRHTEEVENVNFQAIFNKLIPIEISLQGDSLVYDDFIELRHIIESKISRGVAKITSIEIRLEKQVEGHEKIILGIKEDIENMFPHLEFRIEHLMLEIKFKK